jgi:pyruvate dehydrogenase E2 component (dihydrolipoamide acetyltransferase)
MPTNILMPALSPTMTEGTLARWLVREGDAIAAGDVIAEIETDKATMEVEAVDEGTLGRILVPDGTEGVAVNAPIGVILASGETVADASPAAALPAAVPPASNAAAAPTANAPGGLDAENAGTGGYGAVAEQPPVGAPASAGTVQGAVPTALQSTPPAAPQPPSPAGRVVASPLARRLATQDGLDLASLHGTGPNGRIVRRDVEAARTARPAALAPTAPQPAASQPAAPPPPAALQPVAPQSAPPQAAAATPPAPAVAVPGPAALTGTPPTTAPAPVPPSRPAPVAITAPHQRLPNSNIRRTIARRLSESKQFTPHFYCSIDVELDALLDLRAKLNARSPADGLAAFKLSVNDLLIKASAATLREVPGVNASYTDEAILQFDDVDISVAVSIPDGLITPIIRNADRKGLAALSNEAKDLIARARAGKLKPAEFQGGTFSISNMGMFGVRDFAAIINPPQGGILAVGAGEKRAVVRGSELAIATVMTVTLSVDHRVIDGALAAQWVAAFKRIVEDPLSLML